MTNIESEYLFKICIIGTNSKLIDRVLRSLSGDYSIRPKYDPNYMVTGVDITTLKITAKGTPTKLIMVNTQDQINPKMRYNYYRGSTAGIILFDKSDRKSFEKVTDLLEEFRKHTGSNQMITPSERNIHKIPKKIVKEFIPPIALLGINTDSEDVSKDEGRALADLLDLHYFETSSPTFEHIKNIFVYLCEKVIK